MDQEEKIKELRYQVSLLETVLIQVLDHLDSENLEHNIAYIFNYLKDNGDPRQVAAVESLERRCKDYLDEFPG